MDDPISDDERGVLYVKTTCMVCRGKTYQCHYCLGEGKNYIEAADTVIVRWINNLNKERKEDIMKAIQKGSGQ